MFLKYVAAFLAVMAMGVVLSAFWIYAYLLIENAHLGLIKGVTRSTREWLWTFRLRKSMY
jgi:hypothetical protein